MKESFLTLREKNKKDANTEYHRHKQEQEKEEKGLAPNV